MRNGSNPKNPTVVTLVVAVAILTCLFTVAHRQNEIESRVPPVKPFSNTAPQDAPPSVLDPALRSLDSVTQHG
ncbi:MAG TPA: hypothetical protein VJU53_01855 [Burkholderiaceae bacterium]|nr:hypothetical protein [Burkholderiaceae bacterium]